MVELVNEGFSQVKDTFKNVEQRIGLQPKQQNDKKFPELKFRSLRLKKTYVRTDCMSFLYLQNIYSP